MLMGQLKSFSLESLLQICYNESNTGAIEFLKHDIRCGTIGFINGDVVSADFLGMDGIQAIKQISLLEDVDFKYNDTLKPTEKNVESDINFLTIECSRYKDECFEYITKVTEIINENYNVDKVGFYDYDNQMFCEKKGYTIRYFEEIINDVFTVVYLDRVINSRIRIDFNDHIISDSLLLFLKEKGLL